MKGDDHVQTPSLVRSSSCVEGSHPRPSHRLPLLMLCMNPQGSEQWACGRCKACRINKKRDWQSRMLLEAASSEAAFFITLTYRLVQFNDNGAPTLDPEHPQRWLKRFRKLIAPLQVRYFLVGEYGTRTHRPHYHALLFFWTVSPLFAARLSSYLSDSWKLGTHHIGDVTPESVNYCLGYAVKGLTKPSYYSDGRYPEFARFSQGLGKFAFSEFEKGASVLDDGSLVYPATYRVAGKDHVTPKYLRKKAKEAGYVVNHSQAVYSFQTLLDVLPPSRSLAEHDKKQEILDIHRQAIYDEQRIRENRRARSTEKLKRGLIERDRNETL